MKIKSILLAAFCVFLFMKEVSAANFYCAIVTENGKAGIKYFDKIKGIEKWVLPAEYDSIIQTVKFVHEEEQKFRLSSEPFEIPTKGFFLLFKSGKVGLFAVANAEYNKIILPCIYKEIRHSSFSNRLSVNLDGNWGLYHASHTFHDFEKDGKWILSPEWQGVKLFGEDQLTVVTKNDKSGIYDNIFDNWVLDPIYDTITCESVKYRDEIIIITVNGKSGVLSFNRSLSRSPNSKGHWMMPIQGYDNISHTSPRSNFLIVDSTGKKGVWQFTDKPDYKNDRHIQIAWPITAAVNSKVTYNSSDQFLQFEGDGTVGIVSAEGWVKHPSASKGIVTRNYFMFGTKVRMEYDKGKGFEIKSFCKPAMISTVISDTAKYDSAQLRGNILYAYKGKKMTAYLISFQKAKDRFDNYINTDGLFSTLSTLLVSGADKIFPFPAAISDETWLINKTLAYFKNGKWGWWTLEETPYKGGVEMSAIKGSLLVDQLDTVIAKYKTQNRWSMLLVANNKKWGVINTNGKILSPLEHNSYKILKDNLILFQSPQAGLWRRFETQYASRLKEENYHPKWVALRTFTHKNELRVDFTSRSYDEVSYDELLKIDGKEYFLRYWFTPGPLILDYTTDMKIKVNHSVTEKFSYANKEYSIEETPTGVGLYYKNVEIIPPYFEKIYIKGGKDVILVNKKNLEEVGFSMRLLDQNFNTAYFITKADITCSLCKGRGRRMMEVMNIVEGSTNYETTKKTDYKEGSTSVWDTQTRSYKNVKTITPVTSYDTKTSKTADRKIISTQYVSCNDCKGKGIHKDIEQYSSVGSYGFKILGKVDPAVKPDTKNQPYPFNQ